MKIFNLAALGIAALAALPVSAANWSDTYLGFQWSNRFRDPGIKGDIMKQRFELSGVYGWDYGSNFFDVNMLKASHRAPAYSTTGQAMDDVPGNTEVYVTYRTSLDLGKVFKTNMAFGPVKNVEFTAGFDFDSQDNKFASNKRFFMAGPQVGFDVKNGFWNLGIGLGREQNYNGYVLREVNFETSFVAFTAWSKTFQLGVPVTFHGWANYVGEKGKDGFGADTKPETLCDAYLMFDVSKFIGRKAGAFKVGPGFEYWNNKFGGKNVTAPDSEPWNNNQPTSALMLAAEMHF